MIFNRISTNNNEIYSLNAFIEKSNCFLLMSYLAKANLRYLWIFDPVSTASNDAAMRKYLFSSAMTLLRFSVVCLCFLTVQGLSTEILMLQP